MLIRNTAVDLTLVLSILLDATNLSRRVDLLSVIWRVRFQKHGKHMLLVTITVAGNQIEYLIFTRITQCCLTLSN